MKHKKYFLFIPLMIGFFFLAGWIVMLLWNAILPPTIQSVGPLDYPKALGLLALCKLLFGGFRGRSCGKCEPKENFKNEFWKNKMLAMTEEDREKFKLEWKNKCKNE